MFVLKKTESKKLKENFHYAITANTDMRHNGREECCVVLPTRGLGPTPRRLGLVYLTWRSHQVKFCGIFFLTCSLSGYHRKPPLHTSFWRPFPFFLGILRGTESVATQFHFSAANICVQLAHRYRSTLTLHLLWSRAIYKRYASKANFTTSRWG